MNLLFNLSDRRRPEPEWDFGEWFEDLGVGARLAIPTLTELRKRDSPWVRMWATDALRRITTADRRATTPFRANPPTPKKVSLED